MQKSYSSSLISILMLPWSIFVVSLLTKSTSARVGVVTAAAPSLSSTNARMGGTPAPTPMGKGNGATAPAPSPSGAGGVGAPTPGPAPPPSWTDPKLPNTRIVYTRPLAQGINSDSYYLKILATVAGSEEVAKQMMKYTMKDSGSGFVASMTAQQADQLLNNPDVLQVDDVTVHPRLHPGLPN